MPDGPDCTTTSMTLSAADVAFRPDSARVPRRGSSASILGPIAEQLAAAEGASVALTGTTANVGPIEGQVALSRQRAAAVLALLADLGVPQSSMTADGVGSDFMDYVPDHNPDGSLNPVPRPRTARSSSRRHAPACSPARDPRDAPAPRFSTSGMRRRSAARPAHRSRSDRSGSRDSRVWRGANWSAGRSVGQSLREERRHACS